MAALSWRAHSVTPSLAQLAVECSDAINQYASLRPSLFKELLRLPRRWQVKYTRDPAHGVAGIPVKISHQTASVTELGGRPFVGIATVANPETYAPFHDFTLLDEDGQAPLPGTPEHELQMRIEFLLGQLLKVSTVLAKSLALIETLAHQRLFETDLTSIRRLAIDLPVFPYWTSLLKMTAEKWEAVIKAEKVLLDDALVALRSIASEDVNHIANRRLLADGKSNAWKAAVAAAVASVISLIALQGAWLVRR